MTLRAVRIAVLVLGWTIVPTGTTLAQGSSGEPFELVRSLQSLQDQVARGNARAHAYQRVLMGQIGERFAGMNPAGWREPRNVRAAVVFVLSGGAGGVLQALLDSGARVDLDERLIKGALAYAEGRREEAGKLLQGVDARSLDGSLGGHVAYVQAELAAEKEPAKAFAYLDDARLLAPGTLVEEAALRRQIALAATDGDMHRYWPLATQYLRRFPHSVYSRSFRQQFAAQIAVRTDAGNPEDLLKLDATLRGLAAVERRDVCLTIAKAALDRGKVGIAKFAAARAMQSAEPGSPEHARSRLLLAAALVATEGVEQGVETLAAIARGSLNDEDGSLMDAALAVAGQVRRPIESPTPAGVAAAPGEKGEASDRPAGDATAELLARARKAIAYVDQLLTEADQ